jgi:hypothetical protein
VPHALDHRLDRVGRVLAMALSSTRSGDPARATSGPRECSEPMRRRAPGVGLRAPLIGRPEVCGALVALRRP